MNTNNILRYVIYIALGAILFVPFLMPNGLFFPFITSKNFAFRIFTEIAFVSWIILALRDASYRVRRTPLVVAWAIFLVVIFIADMFGENPYKSFWSNSERMEGFITLLHLAAYTIVASSVFVGEKMWKRFFYVSIGISGLLSFMAVLQLSGKVGIHQGSARVDASFGNATYFAVYLLFHLFLIALYFFRTKNIKLRYSYAGLFVFESIILYFTATRGAILGFIGGAIISSLIVVLFARNNRRVRFISLAVLASIVVCVGLFVALKNKPFIKNNPVLGRFSSISISNYNARFLVWNMAIKGFKENPILGWGQESFNYVFNKYYDPRMYNEEQWFDRSHNVIFDWLVAGGILGLLSYLSIFSVALFYIWKKNKENLSLYDKAIITGLLGGYFFQNLFVFDNITSYIMFFSVLGYLNTIYFSGVKNINIESRQFDQAIVNRVAIPLILVVAMFVVYVVNIKPILASNTLIKALRPQKEGIGKNIEYFKKVFAYKTFADSEAREQLSTLAMQARSSDALPEHKQILFDLAKNELDKQLILTPKDTRYLLFMGSFLRNFARYDDAIPYLKKALEYSPLKQTIMMEIGSLYLSQQKNEEALSWLKKALELEPNFTNARIAYGAGLIYSRNFNLAGDVLSKFEDQSIVIFDDRIIRAYAEVRQFDTVIAILNERIDRDPKNHQNHLSLGAIYLELGRRNNAIQELEKAIELNPSFKEQGEYFIKEIRAGRNP